MKIILLGYGKMGKIIEKIAISRGHEITGRIDIGNAEDFETAQADVAIEFSHPDAAFENVTRCINRNLPVVCGTTGWLSRKPEADALCKAKNSAFFYASNYSLGVNVFFKMNEYLAKMMGNLQGYDVTMNEVHHTEKKDAPSGTALTLAEGILKSVKGKTKWVNEKTDVASDLYIESSRIGQVPGIHGIRYSSPIDDIEIRHTAHSREGFASGAVMVAEWLADKKGVLGMDDYLKF